jgi:Ser/Thr protein kinase RdoA (MazF antagonist)
MVVFDAAAAGHHVHGMGLAMEAPTWPAITPDEAAAILARFPAAGRIEALRWHSPRPFSAATLIETGDGGLFLKRHHRRVRTVAGLMEEHRFIAHLSAAGAPVPELLHTAEGESAVASGHWTYELQRQAAGEDVYRDRLSWTPFRSLGHAQAAGEALARLHRASHGFDAPARRQQPLVASFAILAAADPMAAVEAYVEARPALAAFLADRPWRRRLSALFAASGRGLPAIAARQAPLWTHNDWHPSNLLWSGDGRVRTWLDFGLADRSCAAHDLAIAIERTAFAWLELGQGRDDDLADPLAAETLIAGYRMGVAPDPSVVQASIRLLPLVHVEFALSEIDYFAGIVDDRAAAALAWDTYLLGHAEWFLSPAGRDVCARLSDGGGV